MTLADDGEIPSFDPTFPIFVPAVRNRQGTGFLILHPTGLSSDGSRFDATCVPLFTDQQRCLEIGTPRGYGQFIEVSDADELLEFLRTLIEIRAANVVQLDPSLAGLTDRVIPINLAIECVEHLVRGKGRAEE